MREQLNYLLVCEFIKTVDKFHLTVIYDVPVSNISNFKHQL